MSEPTKVDHLSASQLTMYSRCPAQWYLYRSQGPRPPGIALHVGSGVHIGAETAMRQKAATGIDKRPDDVRDAAVAGFDSRVRADDVMFTQEEVSQGLPVVLGRSRDRVAALAHYWACVCQPVYMPMDEDSIEQRWSLWLPNAGIELTGITDLVAEGGIITDWKTTGGRRISQITADTSIALTAYALAYLKQTGSAPTEVRLDVLQEKKTKTERYTLRSTRTQRDYNALLARVSVILGSMRGGYFPPCNQGEWWCSPRFCGWFESGCPYVNSERREAVEE
jgi:hypothetical protein